MVFMTLDGSRDFGGFGVEVVGCFFHVSGQHDIYRFHPDVTEWVAEVRESDVPLAGSDSGVGSDSGGIDGDGFGGDNGAVRRGRSGRRYREGAAGEVCENNKERAENHGEKHSD